MSLKKNSSIKSDDPQKKRAKALVDKGDYDGALKIYQAIDMEKPGDAETLCNLGLISFQKGNFKEAEQAFLKCIKSDSKIPEVYFNLGRLYQNNREFEKALTYYKEIVVNNPEDGVTYYYMGQCARAKGRLDDAIAFLDEAIRLQPDNLEVGVTLATLYIEKKDYQKAEDVLRVTLVSHMDVVPIHFSLGLILKEQGKTESALAQFSRVVQLDENHVQGFYELAECCMVLGLLDQAVPFYAKACKLDSGFTEPVLKLGDLYKKKGKEEDAVIMYRHWIDMNLSNIETFDEAGSEFFREKTLFIANAMKKKGDIQGEAEYQQLAQRVSKDIHREELIEEKRGYDVSLELD